LSAIQVEETVHAPDPPLLTNRHILRFYSPLAISWIFMAIEAPISISVISRLPDAKVNTAAFLILMSLAIWIESPVIDLLSTSTTLAKSRRSYTVLSRFVWWLIAWVTLVHGLIAFTPLYGVVTEGILGVPPEVSQAARPGMMILLLWSAFIGWRRYLQGILIRFGQTRLVGLGTGVRVSTMALSSVALFYGTRLSSITIAAIALMLSVAAEAMFAHWASRRVISKNLTAAPEEGPELSIPKLAKFHLPLTATTMVMLMGGPVVSAALARTPDAVLSLAAWQVGATLLFLMRTIVFALPEVVITLYRDAATARTLSRFCAGVGLGASAVVLLLSLTGADTAFFLGVLKTKPEVATVAHVAFLAGCLTPFVGALQSYVRGMLTAHHLTASRLLAVLVSMAVLIAGLWIGIELKGTGVVVAGVALTVALFAELGILAWFWRRGHRSRSHATS
jgi:progressive ankylosis protein